MAQVMNYHKWPQAATAEIPAYTSSPYGLNLPALPATTFDWANMKDSYSGSYTDAEAEAIATLMQYCGWSVEMEYGPASGTSIIEVVEALKTYFDYDATTQIAVRSCYTADQWADLIYHELAHGRPVFYMGQSSSSGHAFVCDGYKNESEMDFFHINWGWGGVSDDYFVLSALDPDHQGIGGSSSTDGFSYDQVAAIGIQRAGGGGTVAEITPHNINLTANSITLDRTPIRLGESVNVTINVTNNSADDFDGTIYLGKKDVGLLQPCNVVIPSGETRDCELTFTPGDAGRYDFIFYFPGNDGFNYSYNVALATLDVIYAPSPTNLIVTDITPSSVGISWTSLADVSSFEFRYRPAGRDATVFFDDFESGLDKWTIYTEGEAPNSNGWIIVDQEEFKVDAHSGTKTAASYSWYDGTSYQADNWLVTPQLYLGGSLSFWVRTNGKYPDKYEVLLSTTGNGVDDFTTTLQSKTTGPSDWTKVTIDLSAYEGQLGYIAIHHKDNDENYLLIDDFGIIATPIAGGEWASTSTTETSISVTGLTPNTLYEYQVIADYGLLDSKVLYPSYFVTPPYTDVMLSDDATDNSATVAANVGQEAIVTLSGRTLVKDGNWNTLCLPFDLILSGSPLDGDGVVVKTLTDATVSGTTITLTFGEAVTTLQAGVPYIIKWDGGADLTGSDLVFPGVTVKSSDEAARTISKAGGQVKFIGYYDAKPITAANDDIYYLTAGNTLKRTGKNRMLKACRAFFQFSEAASVKNFVLDFGDGTDSIGEVQESSSMAQGPLYNLAGQRLSQPQRGINIQNGKKIVVK